MQCNVSLLENALERVSKNVGDAEKASGESEGSAGNGNGNAGADGTRPPSVLSCLLVCFLLFSFSFLSLFLFVLFLFVFGLLSLLLSLFVRFVGSSSSNSMSSS